MENIKILIVEDDNLLRSVLGEKIVQKGSVVFEAEDGEKALQTVSECKPDIILLDLLLPGIGGFDVLAQIKKDEALKNIPVIVLSNLGGEKEIEKALELGAVDFFIKANYTLDEIIEKTFAVYKDSKKQT
ncbi:MAG: response regulator [Candidatus Pacebacteria bacterium]|nr:response regulator [Candidatus Paceibacterota bacterium]